jgi:hypothetical protein
MVEAPVLAMVLGHVRNAVAAFAQADDPSGESLFLAADCLELEGHLVGLGLAPVSIPPDPDGFACLASAAALLGEQPELVPPLVWESLQLLLARAEQ